MPSDYHARWVKAKRDFEAITGKKKPDPKGKFAKMFNHTGLTGDLKKCDKLIDAIDAEVRDPNKRMKLIQVAKKHIPTISKSAKSYMKQLDDSAKDEIADKNDKTVYAKGLKFLRDRLDSLESGFEAKVAANEIALDKSLGGAAKAAKMVNTALKTCVAHASAGIKKVKSDPTPARFNEIFNASDNPMRKIQVQLIAAANGQKKGILPGDLIVDPRFVADKFTPWQAENRPMTKAEDDVETREILERLKEASGLVKLAGRFMVDLHEKTKL